MMKNFLNTAAIVMALIVSGGCERAESIDAGKTGAESGTHVHADGSTHDDHADDHAHDEVGLGKLSIGGFQAKLSQGHGRVVAGKEGHLVVKLSYSDKGATVVRAWIGTEDRTLSYVGKGEYAPSHDDYDIHAKAPDPLPADAMWWVEIEKPDGTKAVGSIKPLME